MKTFLFFILVQVLVKISKSSILDYYYNIHDELVITVGSMNSIETQIPFDYYYLDICKPKDIVKVDDNLGDIITGDHIYYSGYRVKLDRDSNCNVLCAKNFTREEITVLSWMINRKYTTNWYLDMLPAGLNHYDPYTNRSEIHYSGGIPLGYKANDVAPEEFYVYNHFTFKIYIHKTKETNKVEIVGFNILPVSINHNGTVCSKNATEVLVNNSPDEKQKLLANTIILFTYDVQIEYSNSTLSSRWDHYRHMENDQIHWFSLINSNLIILIFSLAVLHVFCRAIKKDIDIYNTRVTSEDFIDEFGWKQVCNDVFRKPNHSMILSALLGTGVQLCSMVFYSLTFAVMSFLKPESRGSLLTIMILLFVFMGIIAGYVSARFYKTFNGRDWLKNSLLTAFLYPSIAFGVFFLINIMLAFEKSSAALKFSDILSLLVLWLCCSSPLVLIGSFVGIKNKGFKTPCKVNAVPSAIPEKPWYLRTKYLVILTGLIPFAAFFIELVYMMASIWRHHLYFLFAFLYVGMLVLIILCTEISILAIYVQLCKGDYNWWWKSFFISGSPAIYVGLYSIYYFFTLHITRFSTIFIYFGTMALFTSMIFLICGSMGMILTFYFFKKIYSMIKID